MDKDKAIKILQAVACCTILDSCDMCPWYKTKDCIGTAFSKELVGEAIKAVSGE